MKRIVIVATLILCAVAGAGVASASAKPHPDLPDTPAFTSRYPAVEQQLTLEARMDALERRVDAVEGQAGVLTLLRAHDIEWIETNRAYDLQVQGAQRREMLRELYSLQRAVYVDAGCP